MHVAAGCPSRGPLVAQQLAGLHGLARLHDDLPEVRVHAAVAVPVVRDDDDRQRRPQVPLLETAEVRTQVADPAHDMVVPAARGQDHAVVRCHHPVAAEGGEVDAVVETLAVHDAGAPDRRPERQRQADLGKRPAVAGQEVEGGRARVPDELGREAAGRAARGDDGGPGRDADAGDWGSRWGPAKRARSAMVTASEWQLPWRSLPWALPPSGPARSRWARCPARCRSSTPPRGAAAGSTTSTASAAAAPIRT